MSAVASRRRAGGRIALALALGATLAAGGDPERAQAQDAARPNVVVIVTDDQTLEMTRRATMPNVVRKLIRKGTNFKQAMITTPTCCPSRASFITGQYGHNNGVLVNDYSLLRDEHNVLPAWLQEAGYRTIHIGKFMNRYRRTHGGNRIAPGWSRWFTALEPYSFYDYILRINGRKKEYGKRGKHYLTRVLNKFAVNEIRQAPKRKPFYLQLDHYAPHIAPGDAGGRCEKAAVPDPRDYRRFTDVELPRGPGFNERDVSDKPSFIQEMKRLKKRKIRDLERRYGCALASLRAVDRGVGRILKALKKEGILNETVVVFESDNGFYYGEHRIPDAKQNPYEEAVRVPLAFRVPKRVLGGSRPARRVNSLVANIDLAPTILDLAGAAPCVDGECRTLDGRSLMPLIASGDGALPPDRSFAVEFGREAQNAPVLGGRACTYTGVRTPRYMWAHHTSAIDRRTRACEPVDDVEVYDLNQDPFQLESFHDAPPASARGQTVAGLAERARRLSDCAGIAGRDPAPPSGNHCE